jgi:hypothetical protein
MSDHSREASFLSRLDALLTAGGHVGIPDAAPHEAGRLELAITLRHLDIAGESLVREGLGRRLGEACRHAPCTRESRAPHVSRPRPGRLVAAALFGAAVLMASLLAVSPGIRAALAATWESLFGRRIVTHTMQESIDSLTAFWAQADDGRYWSLSTPYGTAEGMVTHGMKPYSRHYVGLRALARDADLDVMTPTVWPDELPAFLRFKEGWLNPDGSVWLIFCTGPWEFMLSQIPIAKAAGAMAPTFVTTWTDTTSARPADEPRTCIWDGIEVRWVPDSEDDRSASHRWARPRTPGDPAYGSLHWEHDGVTYSLKGQNLTLTRAEEIWRSLRPVGE